MDLDFSDLLANIVEEPPDWPLNPPAGFSDYAPAGFSEHPAGFPGTSNPDAYSGTSTPLNYQPIFDIHSHNQSTTSFGSNDTRRTGTTGPSATSTSSLSVPEAFAAQLPSLDLSSGLLPVFRTLCSYTPPPLASQASFLRKFPAWKPHLSPVLDFAVSLAFHYEDIIPIDDSEGKLTPIMIRHTPRAVFAIVAGDAHNGGSFGADGAAGLYWTHCLVQWGVDHLIAMTDNVRRTGRKHMGRYGMISFRSDRPHAHEANSHTFKTVAKDWYYLNEAGSHTGFLSHPVPWDVLGECFYEAPDSIYRRMMNVFSCYPSLLEGNDGIILWQSIVPPNAMKVVLIGLRHNLRECSNLPQAGKLRRMLWDLQDHNDNYVLNDFLKDPYRESILKFKCVATARHYKALVQLVPVLEEILSESGGEA